jgi:hypothetical protein
MTAARYKSLMWRKAEPTRAIPTSGSVAVIQRCGDHACSPDGCERDPRPRALADELTHVLPQRKPSGPTATQPPGPGVPASARRAARAADQRLAPQTRGMLEPQFGADFGDVRVHTDGPSTREVAALAYTIGSAIVFAPGRYQPDRGPGLRLLAHELTHVVQQRRGAVAPQAQHPGPPGLDPAEREAEAMADRAGSAAAARAGGTLSYREATEYAECLRIMGTTAREFCDREVLGRLPQVVPDVSLAGRPQAERLQLKVHKAVLGAATVTAVERFFGPTPAAAPAVPAGLRLLLGTSVEPQFRNGIQALGAYILDWISNTKPPASPFLPPDHTFNLAIQATGQVFRLTRLGVSTLLIEQVGPIRAGPAAVPEAEAKAGGFEVAKRRFELGGGWRTNHAARLEAGLEAMPAGLLPPAGTLFKREAVKKCTKEEIAAKTCDPNWAGQHWYNFAAKRHEITLFDGAFVENARRDGTWPVLYTIIAHEIGHALDYEPLRRGLTTFNLTKTTKSEKEREAAILGVRSLSGRRWKESGKKAAKAAGTIEFSVDENVASRAGEYRAAAFADGLQADPSGKLSQGLTDYSEERWSDNFAESFSIYAADPELLRELRPNVFAYFQRKFPR